LKLKPSSKQEPKTSSKAKKKPKGCGGELESENKKDEELDKLPHGASLKTK